MGRHSKRDSFERFYLTKVALGEGCGCAEQATRLRDLETYSRGIAARDKASPVRGALFHLPLTRFFHRAARWLRPGSA